MEFNIVVKSPEEAKDLAKEIHDLYMKGLSYNASMRIVAERYKKQKSQCSCNQTKSNDINKKFNSIISPKEVI